MKAILIDPLSRKINQIDVDGGLDSIKSALSCSTITGVFYMNNGDYLYADDEALFRSDVAFFIVREHSLQPVAGPGLIIGSDGEGGDASCKSDIDYIRNQVTFLRPDEAILLSE